jgi:hypothetical protein
VLAVFSLGIILGYLIARRAFDKAIAYLDLRHHQENLDQTPLSMSILSPSPQKAAKDAAYRRQIENTLGKNCILDVVKMIYRRLLTVVYTGYA